MYCYNNNNNACFFFFLQEDLEYHNRQDLIGHTDCDVFVNGENMGGWWPQHSAAVTGVKATRHCPCPKCFLCAVFDLVILVTLHQKCVSLMISHLFLSMCTN